MIHYSYDLLITFFRSSAHRAGEPESLHSNENQIASPARYAFKSSGH
jgi:hypothetical protein